MMANAKTTDPNVFILPDLGEGVHEAELISWKVKPGDTVAEHDILAEMETDKALVEVPSPRAGTISQLHGSEGDTLHVGNPLVTYEGDDAASEPSAAAAGTSNGQATAQANTADTDRAGEQQTDADADADAGTVVGAMSDAMAGMGGGDGKPLAAPAVRRHARDLGVDLSRVKGSGIGGRITKKDVDAYASGEGGARRTQAAASVSQPTSSGQQQQPQPQQQQRQQPQGQQPPSTQTQPQSRPMPHAPAASAHQAGQQGAHRPQTHHSPPQPMTGYAQTGYAQTAYGQQAYGGQGQAYGQPGVFPAPQPMYPMPGMPAMGYGYGMPGMPMPYPGTPYGYMPMPPMPQQMLPYPSPPMPSPMPPQAPQGLPPAPGFTPFPSGRSVPDPAQRSAVGPGDDEARTPFRGIRRKIATGLRNSVDTAVHFMVCDEADITELDAIRRETAQQTGEKISYLPFICRAVCRAIGPGAGGRFGALNATVDDDNEQIVEHGPVHLGIATDTESGLMVPVISDADRLGTLELGRAIVDTARAARDRSIERERLTGSTFTISNVGSHAGRFATPVINYPEVAIIAVGKAYDGVVVRDGQAAVGKVLPLSLACDHRVVDGATAALALAEIIRQLRDDPASLL